MTIYPAMRSIVVKYNGSRLLTKELFRPIPDLSESAPTLPVKITVVGFSSSNFPRSSLNYFLGTPLRSPFRLTFKYPVM